MVRPSCLVGGVVAVRLLVRRSVPDYCRDLALSESMVGTAREGVRRWILVEDGDPWGVKPPADSCLPDPVKAGLVALGREAGTQIQLIRQPGRGRGRSPGRGPRRRVFAATAGEGAADRALWTGRIELDALAEATSFDALVARLQPAAGPVWLVCGHGARDRCCAKFGFPVFEALHPRAPERVWLASHLGGHRYAPVVLTLPNGLLWGRVDAPDALWAAVEAGQLGPLELLRGRCCHPKPVQAAEIMLRAREGLRGDQDLAWVETEALDQGSHRVRFRHGNQLLDVHVEAIESEGLLGPPSCGDPPKRRAAFRLRML